MTTGMKNDLPMLYGERTVTIGIWHEREARDIDRCPSYYAADHERIRTVPGDYPLRLKYVGGYILPMPYWLLCGIEAVRVSGRLYSGFGGVNYSSTELPAGERSDYHLQTYEYQLRDLVAAGLVTLDPKYAFLLEGDTGWRSERAPKTWEQLDAIAA